MRGCENRPVSVRQRGTILSYEKEIRMNAQEKLKNDANNQPADTLSDLPVTEAQAERTKGGGSGPHVRVFDGSNGTLLV